jgi:hypothetical protein
MVLLTVVAAGLLAATLWLWPVLARRGVTAVTLRAGLLVALQASVLGVVFVSVNRTYEFYASWSDLLGTDHSVAQVVPARPGGTGAVTAGQAPPVVTLASNPVMVPGARRDLVGRLAEVRFAGPVSGIAATGHVYLPPGYSPHSRPLPVIVIISRRAAPPPPATVRSGSRRWRPPRSGPGGWRPRSSPCCPRRSQAGPTRAAWTRRAARRRQPSSPRICRRR